MKPTAHYRTLGDQKVVVGMCAHIIGCYDHPANLEGDYIITSHVVAYDEQTGRIETENTIYERI